jgi:hypothetical protein
MWVKLQMRELKALRKRVEDANSAKTGNALLDAFTQLRRGGQTFFESYLKYRAIVESWLYMFLGWLSFIGFLWGGFGLFITINDIILDTLACDQQVILAFLHGYSFGFVVFLTWGIIGLVLSITQSLSSSSYVSVALMKLAKSMDDSLHHGLPVWLTLIQSFVLKNSSDELGLSERQVKEELRQLHERMREVDDELKGRKQLAQRLHVLERQNLSEAEFMRQCQERLDSFLGHTKPVVALLAANVQTNLTVDSSTASSGGHLSRVGKGASPHALQTAETDSEEHDST